MMSPKTISVSFALVGFCVAAPAAEPDFYQDVFPFLKANCVSCHNKTTTKADLNMETPEEMKKGGESGPAIIPGKSAESLVVLASLHKEDMEMPPKNNKSGAVSLTPSEIAILSKWIDAGAKSSVQQERAVAWQPLAAGVHPIYAVAMSTDGRYAACGRANKIFVYDLATHELAAEITDAKEQAGGAHRALVQSLAFSPDGKRLASGSFREVKLWRMADSEPTAAATTAAPVDPALLKQITAAAKTPVLASASSPDGKQVVTAGADGVVRVWDRASAKLITELRGSASAERRIADLEWTMAAQGLEQAFQKAALAKIDAQNKALDELLKKANEAIVAMKKVLPEKQKAVPPATAAKAAAQKAVDELIAAAKDKPADAAAEKAIKDAQDKLLTAKMEETSALAAVSAAESNVRDAEDDLKRITGTKDANAKAHAAATAAMASSKKVHDTAAADLAALKTSLTKSVAKTGAVSFSADSKRVAALSDDGALRVWAVATGMPIEEVAMNGANQSQISASSSGAFIASVARSVTIGGKPRWLHERTLAAGVFADRVNAVCFSPDGKLLATGGGELSRAGDIHIFEAATGKLAKTWTERHEDSVLSLAFSPDGKRIASGAADKIARVTDIDTGKQVNVFEGHTHYVSGVAFRADGRVLATAGADGVVITWDMLMGERKKKIEGWSKEVTSVQFIGATNQIVTSAGDNLIRIVTDEGAQVRALPKLPDFMQAAASTPNGRTIIGGGEDSVLRVWNGTNGAEVAVFESK